jgi:hydrogenase-1 operon protein HyaE
VLLPEAARLAQARFGFHHWPALVVLKDGRYVGAIDGLREWDVYRDQLESAARAPSRRAPPTRGHRRARCRRACRRLCVIGCNQERR